MRVIEPHIHMVARTTQDYQRMTMMHTVCCVEPAFWAGYDRPSAAAFYDYFTQITEFEPTRAALYNIKHYCHICMNPKEAENVQLSREVISFMPEFLDKPNALGIGEIGLNKNTKNEMIILEEQINLAVQMDRVMWIHTPHLDDKLKGTKMIIAALKNRSDLNPETVCFDHAEEHTIGLIRDAGFWASMTIYPITKNSPSRVVDAVERFGLEHIMVDASGDWGPSDPRTLHEAIFEMRKRGHRDDDIETLFYNNPCYFLGQSDKFTFQATRPKTEAWQHL